MSEIRGVSDKVEMSQGLEVIYLLDKQISPSSYFLIHEYIQKGLINDDTPFNLHFNHPHPVKPRLSPSLEDHPPFYQPQVLSTNLNGFQAIL